MSPNGSTIKAGRRRGSPLFPPHSKGADEDAERMTRGWQGAGGSFAGLFEFEGDLKKSLSYLVCNTGLLTILLQLEAARYLR